MRTLASRLAAASVAAMVLLAPPLAGARMLSFTEEFQALAAAQQQKEGSPAGAVDFALKDLDGKTVKLSQLRGHPVVVDFWATWCPPCRDEIPELKKLYDKYHKSRGLVILGVACDTVQGEGEKVVRPFVKELAINYPILLADDAVLDQFDIMALPTALFVTPDGKVVGRLRGAGPTNELVEAVEQLLARSAHQAAPPAKQKGSQEGNWVTISYKR